MKLSTLRARIALAYGVLILVCLGAYSMAVGISYRVHVHAELDRAAHEDVELAIRSVVLDADGAPAWPGGELWQQVREEEGGGHFIELWSPAGRRLLSVGTMDPPAMGPPEPGCVGRPPRSRELATGPFRVACERIVVSGAPFVVRAGVSEVPARREVRSLSLQLAGFSAAVLALGGVGGLLVARRSLGPLARMAEHARRITAEQLHDHLPAEDAGAELDQLRDAFNGTLARLEESFDRLKTFSAQASHELRTPLTVVRSVGEVALSQPRGEAELREALETMLEEVDRLSRLIDALLALARAEAGRARLRMEPVDLGPLASEVVERLAVLAEERGQRLELRVDGPAHVRGDRIALRQALQNLVHNAIKYAPPSSAIRVRVRDADSMCAVEVRDEGPGVPPESRARVFERFYRGAARDGEGVGLGLSIVKATAEAHGGRVELDSEVGSGSTFRLVVPRHVAG